MNSGKKKFGGQPGPWVTLYPEEVDWNYEHGSRRPPLSLGTGEPGKCRPILKLELEKRIVKQ